MVYIIILQPISQTSRGKIRPAAKTIAAEREPIAALYPECHVQFDNMGAERKKAALPYGS